MLSVSLIANSHSDQSRAPVTDESFSPGIENRLAANCFCTSSIYLGRISLLSISHIEVSYQLVIEQYCAIAGR